MIPELGHFSLIFAFVCALILAVLPIVSTKFSVQQYQMAAVGLTRVQFIFILLSIGTLFWSFYTTDLSVRYVQENAHHNLPVYYRLTAVWGAHEGSMLLWVALFSCWCWLVSRSNKLLPPNVHASLLSILGILSAGFILFILYTSNPFLRWLPNSPIEGSDLNPLLQDPGLIVHPPLLYMGYVGLSIPFASQMCALFFPEHVQVLAKWTRQWALAAWGFLTLGIALGSYWAYYELGWGGYWFWDPVENASFMPWLVTAALVHSLIMTDKRKSFQGWTSLLAIYAFALSLIGTFLVRSGILTSVHAFAVSPERGMYILIFLTLVIASALGVFCLRVHHIKQRVEFASLSKESILLMNNLFLVAVASTVLLGTLYPLFIDALFGEKISVGAPYFNAVFIPMMLPLMLIMGLAPSVRFYQDKWQSVIHANRWPLLTSVVLSISAALLCHSWIFAFGILAGCCVIFCTIRLAIAKFRKNQWRSPSVVGMIAAHLGVGVVIVGLTLSHQLSIEKEFDIGLSEQVSVGKYHFVFSDIKSITGSNYTGAQAVFTVKDNSGDVIKRLYPEKRIYVPRNSPMTETAIDSNPLRDIYIALSEPTSAQNTWAVRIYVKPYIVWIWMGGLLIAFGAFFAVFGVTLRTKPKPVDIKQTKVEFITQSRLPARDLI